MIDQSQISESKNFIIRKLGDKDEKLNFLVIALEKKIYDMEKKKFEIEKKLEKAFTFEFVKFLEEKIEEIEKHYRIV